MVYPSSQYDILIFENYLLSSSPPQKTTKPFVHTRKNGHSYILNRVVPPPSLSFSKETRNNRERERENSKNRRVSASRDVKIFLDNIVCRLWNFSLDCGTSGEYHYRRIKKLREGVEQRCCNSVRGRASPLWGTLTMLRREKEIRAALPLCLPDLHAEYRAAQICF